MPQSPRSILFALVVALFPAATSLRADPPPDIKLRWRNYCICAHLDLTSGESHYCLTLVGDMVLPPAAPLAIAVDARITQALDGDGRLVQPTPHPHDPKDAVTAIAADRPRRPPSSTAQGLGNYLFGSRLNDPQEMRAYLRLPAMPSRLSLLRGQVEVLIPGPPNEFVIPLDAAPDWTPIVPGLEVKLQRTGATVQSQIRRPAPAGPTDRRSILGPPLILKTEFLDAAGKTLDYTPRTRGTGWRDGYFWTLSDSEVRIPAGRDAKAVRFSVIVTAQTHLLPFEIQDLPAGELLHRSPAADHPSTPTLKERS